MCISAVVCPLSLLSCPSIVRQHPGRKDSYLWMIPTGWFHDPKTAEYNSTRMSWKNSHLLKPKCTTVQDVWQPWHQGNVSWIQNEFLVTAREYHPRFHREKDIALTGEDIHLSCFWLTPGTWFACCRYTISPSIYLKAFQSPLSELFQFKYIT